MTFKCPRGHDSTDSDYCSECGALIGQTNLPKDQATATAPTTDICPDCGSPRIAGNRFCEVCRYDFINQVSTSPAEAGAPASPPAQASPDTALSPQSSVLSPGCPAPPAQTTPDTDQAAISISAPSPPAARLDIAILVDPSLPTDEETRANCPQNAPERIFPLDLDENLLGRRSNAKGIYPEIEVNDPGVSHRHLKFIKQSDGTFAILELGSANGTTLNGAALEPGVLTPVKAGDDLVIGMWSRVQIRDRGRL